MNTPNPPSGFPSPKPTEAGIYDFLIGGTHHTPADQEAAKRAIAILPELDFAAKENRKFLRRVVEYLAEQGIRQYLDLGSGYPTGGQVHEVAGQIVSNPHVIYVDYDPQVAEESQELLKGRDNVLTITQDVRHPWDILDNPEVIRLIDWSKPVAVLAVAILHFIKDEDSPVEIIATLREHMAPGSYLVISHASGGENPDAAEDVTRVWDRTRSSAALREPSEIQELFIGFDMVSPGIVTTTEWGTNEPAPTDQGVVLCGVGKVP